VASTEGEEVSALRVAIQDLENQIEEQKHKISNTPMLLLRVSVSGGEEEGGGCRRGNGESGHIDMGVFARGGKLC
jgi:hypothetical protein